MGGVLRRPPEDSTVMPSRGGMTLNLVTYHKALSPTRRARNNSDRILLSTVFIGTPVPSVLSLRRKRVANKVNPARRGRSYPVRDVRFKTVQRQPGVPHIRPDARGAPLFSRGGTLVPSNAVCETTAGWYQPERPQRNPHGPGS